MKGFWEKYRLWVIITIAFLLIITVFSKNTVLEAMAIRRRIKVMQKEQQICPRNLLYEGPRRGDIPFGGMKILIINGPNLNLIGKREPSIYGSTDFETWFAALRRTYAARNVELTYRQSNIEGELIDCIQAADGRYDGVILNAGGYTHTSVAIADAIRAVGVPVVEVQISNIFARENYRQQSLTGAACRGAVTGFGLDSYRLAIESFLLPR